MGTKRGIVGPPPTSSFEVFKYFDGQAQIDGNCYGVGGFIFFEKNLVLISKWGRGGGVFGQTTKLSCLDSRCFYILQGLGMSRPSETFGDSKLIIDWVKGRGRCQVAVLEN